MSRTQRALVAAIVAVTVAIVAVAATGAPPPARTGEPAAIHVTQRGSDREGDGSHARPWQTLAHACSRAAHGNRRTIKLGSGTFLVPTTCLLPCGVSLRGAGRSRTTVHGPASPLIAVRGCTSARNRQAITDLHLDGQDRQAGTYGLDVRRVRGLTIRNLVAEGFRGPVNAGGGAINIAGAWNLDLGHSTIRNSGNYDGDSCAGALGLGHLTDAKVHHLTISEDRGYAVKASSGPDEADTGGGVLRNVDFSHLTVRSIAPTGSCPDGGTRSWNSLAFELWETDAVNVQIRDSTFNRTVSLTDIGLGSPRPSGWRYRIHHNRFIEDGGNNYAIELDQHSSLVANNFFFGGLYPIANFTRDVKRGNLIRNNVFDNAHGPTALVHVTAGVRDWRFLNNTVVLRRPEWRDGLFSLAQQGNERSTITIANNAFVSTHPLGDRLGTGLALATIRRNSFYNLAPRGSGAIVGNPLLPLSGGFPSAYRPSAASPLIDAGLRLDGVPRFKGKAPDLGAREVR